MSSTSRAICAAAAAAITFHRASSAYSAGARAGAYNTPHSAPFHILIY